MVPGNVPPTCSLPAGKMDSPYSARFRLASSGEKSRRHPPAGGLQRGGTPGARRFAAATLPSAERRSADE